MNDLIPAWVAALHGHALIIKTLDKKAPQWLPSNPWRLATCVCGWRGTHELYEDFELPLRWDWNEHVCYEIAMVAPVRV